MKETKTKSKTAGTMRPVRHLFGRGRVSSKGWVVIPKEIRDELGIEPGDELSFMLVPPGPNMKQDRRLSTIHINKVPPTVNELLDLTRGMFIRRRGERSMTEMLVEERRKEVADEERKLRMWRRKRRTSA